MGRRIRISLGTLALALAPAAAWAQQPSGILPGQEPEIARPIPYWLSFPIAAAAIGLVLLIGFLYWRVSSRFYGTEEVPAPSSRPRFVGATAVAKPQAATVAAPPKPAAPAAAPAAPPAKPAAAPVAEKPAAETADAEPAAAPAAEPAKPAAAGGHVEPDQETFDRTLQEQIDKGVDRRVAEGRARAAAIKAAREKAG